jgi:hypothetical protein
MMDVVKKGKRKPKRYSKDAVKKGNRKPKRRRRLWHDLCDGGFLYWKSTGGVLAIKAIVFSWQSVCGSVRYFLE